MEKKYCVKSSQIHQSAVPMGVYRHRVNPPKGVPFERLLETDCWDSVSDKFSVREPHHQGQIIEIYPDDGSYYAELIATKVRTGQVSVKKVMHVALAKDESVVKAEEDAFEVKLRGPKKWSVMRKKDNQVMIDGIATKEEAEAEMTKYIEELVA
jgi:hypothetical protein